MGCCGGKEAKLSPAATKLLDEANPTKDDFECTALFNGIRTAVTPSVLPGVNTVRGLLVQLVGNIFEHLVYNVTGTLEVTGLEFHLPPDGTKLTPQIWLAIQNSVLAKTTTGLVSQTSYEIMNSIDEQKEVEGGKDAIWGYGKSFPKNEILGDLFSTTNLARLLNYDASSQTYVLDFSHGGEKTGQPEWSKALLRALDPMVYVQIRTSFTASINDQGQLKLLPCKVDILDEKGETTKTVEAADSEEWRNLMTTTGTIAMYVYENFHACLHTMSATCATGLLMSVAHGNDAHALLYPVVSNVFFKLEEVFSALWGENGVLVKSKNEGFQAEPEKTYAACSDILKALSSSAANGDVDKIMKDWVVPSGPVPEEHMKCFAPGTKAELEAACKFGESVQKIFSGDEAHKKTTERLVDAYAKLGQEVFGPLAQLGATLTCVCIAGGVFHSQTMLTKVFFTPLASIAGKCSPPEELSPAIITNLRAVFGTIDKFEDDLEFGLFKTSKSNKYHAAAQLFHEDVIKLRADLSAKYKESPVESGVAPTFFFEKNQAKKLGFSNTPTTYV